MILERNSKIILWLLVVYQLASVYLMATGTAPLELAWVNLSLSMAYILLAPTYFAVLFLLVSIPFFITFPNFYSDTMSTWRLLFLWLFVVWLFRSWLGEFKDSGLPNFFKRVMEATQIFVKKLFRNFSLWDVFIGLFGLICLVSLSWANYKVPGLKHLIFLTNLYFLYIVVVNVVKTRTQIVEIIKYSAISLGVVVVLGYLQFIGTFFVPQYYFWQYWATMVSKVYYGLSLANVLIYSNSWFSYTGPNIDLRMFSIMPDSHSFAMIAALLMTFLLPLTYIYDKAKVFTKRPLPVVPNRVNYYIWAAVRFSGLAVIFSGTRGVWVGLLAPLLLSALFYIKRIARPAMKMIFGSLIMIVILFLLSPLINYGLHAIKFQSYKENFLSRAESIYDLKEESNANRLLIWQHSLTYFTQHPFGVGYGNFVVSLVPDSARSLPFEEVSNYKNYRYNLPQKFVTAHSLYLNILVELGIMGIALFGLIFLAYFKKVWDFIRSIDFSDTLLSFFVVNTAFMVLWFLAYSVFDVTMFNDKILMYLFVSLALSGIIIKRYQEFKE